MIGRATWFRGRRPPWIGGWPRLPLLGWTLAVAVVASGLTVAVIRTVRPVLDIDQARHEVIDALENVLLHDSLVPQYERVVNQFDGRGFVAGIGDFATADGGALSVVTAYTARVGDNELARTQLEPLRQLARDHSGDTSGLVGFPDAWQRAGQDEAFRGVQVDVRESRGFQPALERARDLGLVTPLGLAIIYDSLLQHGAANQPDGLPTLVERTKARMGGTPRTGSERDWLAAFLDERRTVLLGPSDPTHQSVWPLSTGRLDVLAGLLAAHRDDLTPPFQVNPYGTAHLIDLRADGTGVAGTDDTDQVAIRPGRSPTPMGPPSAAAPSSPSQPSPARPSSPPPGPAGPPSTSTSRAGTRTPTTSAPPVTPQAGLVVRIVNANSGKPFGIGGNSVDDGAAIEQNSSPGTAQQWRITVSPAGCFTLLNMRSGKALDNPDGSGEWGRRMQQWSAGPPGNPNQSWCFDAAGNGWYTIRNLASGLVLDLTDGGYFDGNPIQQWGGGPPGNLNQNWTLELVR